jgi:serine/threonine protein phosphatase PrpC
MSVHLSIAGRSDVGPVRKTNEDAFVVADLSRGEPDGGTRWKGELEVGARGALLAVSDGMGGAQQGELASALVVSSLARALSAQPHGQTSLEKITGAVEDAHRAVWEEACQRGIKMGATLTAAYVRAYEQSAAVYVAEVGDSRAYLLRAGRLTQLTKDQSYVQMLIDSGAVDAEQAQSLPFRNVILQAMGHQPKVAVALGRLDLRALDCLVLCSDGLTAELSNEEIRVTVLSSPDLAVAAERLVDLANARGGRDNTTVLLIGVSGDMPEANVGERLEQTYRILETFNPLVHAGRL